MTDDRCPRCAGDHDGYEAGTLGAELRCLHAQALRLGAPLLADQILELQASLLTTTLDDQLLLDWPETFVVSDGFGNVVGHVAGPEQLRDDALGRLATGLGVPDDVLRSLGPQHWTGYDRYGDHLGAERDRFVGESVHYDGGELDLDQVRRDIRSAETCETPYGDGPFCEVCGLPVPTESTQAPEQPPMPGEPTVCLIDHGPLTLRQRWARWRSKR